MSETDQVIHCEVTEISNNEKSFVSFVYGSNDQGDRTLLWRNLSYHADLWRNAPWAIMGDFNAIRFKSENLGGRGGWNSSMGAFFEFLDEAELDDLRFEGIFFSWNNHSPGDANIARKLDQTLKHETWDLTYKQSFAEFLESKISDHSPMIVRVGSRADNI